MYLVLPPSNLKLVDIGDGASDTGLGGEVMNPDWAALATFGSRQKAHLTKRMRNAVSRKDQEMKSRQITWSPFCATLGIANEPPSFDDDSLQPTSQRWFFV